METAQTPVFFHGHTHVQEAWLRQPDAIWTRLSGPAFVIEEAAGRCLVGVGSVGLPHDGRGACYTLYDDVARRVTWRRA
jgi:hypothetical protein